MKTLFSGLLITCISLYSYCQEIVINTGGSPQMFLDIQAGADYLYLPGFNRTLYRASYTDLQNYQPIAEIGTGPTPEIWRCAYDNNNDIIYLNTFGGELFSIDLNESIPITPNFIGFPGVSTGMTLANDELIFANGSNLSTIDKSDGNDTTIYSDSFGDVRNPVFSSGSYYFQVYNPPYNSIIKLNMDGTNITREEIYSFDGNAFVQSSTIENGYLYMGLESGLIMRFDIQNTNYPLSPEIFNFQDRGVLGLAVKDSQLYSSVNNTLVYRIDDNVLSNNDLNSTAINIFPNPVKEFLTVEISNMQPFEYQLFNIGGLLISEGQAEDRIDLSNISQGAYFLKIQNNKDVYIKKLLKQ